jgi:hypothetical protein
MKHIPQLYIYSEKKHNNNNNNNNNNERSFEWEAIASRNTNLPKGEQTWPTLMRL